MWMENVSPAFKKTKQNRRKEKTAELDRHGLKCNLNIWLKAIHSWIILSLLSGMRRSLVQSP